jgi:hypothetical protein
MSRTDLTSVRAAERVPRIPWYPGRELGQPQAGPQGGIQGRIPQIRVIAKTPDYGAARLHPGYKIKEFSTREICNLFPGHRTSPSREGGELPFIIAPRLVSFSTKERGVRRQASAVLRCGGVSADRG